MTQLMSQPSILSLKNTKTMIMILILIRNLDPKLTIKDIGIRLGLQTEPSRQMTNLP